MKAPNDKTCVEPDTYNNRRPLPNGTWLTMRRVRQLMLLPLASVFLQKRISNSPWISASLQSPVCSQSTFLRFFWESRASYSAFGASSFKDGPTHVAWVLHPAALAGLSQPLGPCHRLGGSGVAGFLALCTVSKRLV